MFKTPPLFFLTIIFVLFCNSGFSAAIPADSSSSKPHKLSQKEFLKKYGTDDSSRALIKDYFNKRAWFRNAALLYGTLSGTGYIILNGIASKGSDVVNGKGVFAAFLVLLFGVATPVVAYRWLRTSRKKLFGILEDYKKNKILPEKIRRSSSFQRVLKQENKQVN